MGSNCFTINLIEVGTVIESLKTQSPSYLFIYSFYRSFTRMKQLYFSNVRPIERHPPEGMGSGFDPWKWGME